MCIQDGMLPCRDNKNANVQKLGSGFCRLRTLGQSRYIKFDCRKKVNSLIHEGAFSQRGDSQTTVTRGSTVKHLITIQHKIIILGVTTVYYLSFLNF